MKMNIPQHVIDSHQHKYDEGKQDFLNKINANKGLLPKDEFLNLKNR
jgi:hypothetical protein